MKSLRERVEDIRVVTADGCWWPRRFIEPHGYARMMVAGQVRYLHVLSYELFVGPIPAGKQIDHRCRKRWCFNPEHLEPVTSVENSRRGAHPNFVAQREGRCRQGHELTEDNILRRGDGRARCRICTNEYRKRAK